MRKLFLSSFILLGTGCETLANDPYFSQFIPSIKFDSLQVNEVNFQEIDTEFVFAIDNPNPVGLDIDQFSYNLAFSEVDWMDGDNPDGLLIDADGESKVSLPTHIVFSDLYDMVQASRGADSLPFALNGDFGVRLDSSTIVTSETSASDTNEGELITLPYDADGDFPALRRPNFSFSKLKVKDFSWSEIDLSLEFDVDNEHASNLIFQRFSYDLDLGGNSVISGVADNLEEIIHGIDEETSTDVNRKLKIPISLSTSDIGQSLISVFTGGGNLSLGFNAVSDVDTPFGLVELNIDETGNVDVELQ